MVFWGRRMVGSIRHVPIQLVTKRLRGLSPDKVNPFPQLPHVVFDTKKREVVANLDGFPSVHGVWAVPELGKVYASENTE
jgi:hypothetical protein